MTSSEIKELLEKMKKFKEEVTASKEAAQEFLIRMGLVTKKGNLRKPYKNLYIPKEDTLGRM